MKNREERHITKNCSKCLENGDIFDERGEGKNRRMFVLNFTQSSVVCSVKENQQIEQKIMRNFYFEVFKENHLAKFLNVAD